MRSPDALLRRAGPAEAELFLYDAPYDPFGVGEFVRRRADLHLLEGLVVITEWDARDHTPIGDDK